MLVPAAKIAKANERKSVMDTIVMAFADDPVLRWMLPKAHEYLATAADIQSGLGGRAFENGSAYILDDFSAAALWLPPGVDVDAEALARIVETRMAPALQGDLEGLVGQMMTFHPHTPHWYLAVLGVDIHRQGKGLGSILMKEALLRVDREHLPAYLESSNPRNVPFYERHGFEAVGRIQSGTSPVLTPMLRPAR